MGRTIVLVALLSVGCGGGGDKPPEGCGPGDPCPSQFVCDPITSLCVRPDAGACVPTNPSTEVCDGVDNDCDGKIDNVDVGGDGIYDCQHIALLGNPGTFPSANFVAWLQGNGSQVVRLLTDTTTQLDHALIDPYVVLIVDNLTRTFTPTEAAVLTEWVEAGGGVMVMSGYTGGQSDLDRPNSLMAGIGLAFQPGLRSGPVTTFVAHPLTEGLTSVTFSGGFNVAPVGGVTGGTNTTVASLVSGPVGIAQTRGKGRVYAWGDEWVTFDSEWSSMPMIKQFWVDTLGWLEGLR